MKANIEKINKYFDLTGDFEGQLFFYGMLVIGGLTGIISVVSLILGGLQ
ncbi:hypothetical protein ABEX38_30020 [Priestia megaterium]